MDKRWSLLFIIPLATALVAFFATNQLLFTALGFVVGYILMEGLRFLLLPPHLHRAVRNYQRGDLEQALTLAQRSIHARPQRWEPHYLQALAFFARGDLTEAEQSARNALRLNSENDPGHLVLGQVLFAQKRFAQAREAFEEAVRLNGREGLNRYHLGATLFRVGQFELAIPHLELALRLGIDQDQLTLLAHYYLGRSLQEIGRHEDAEQTFEGLQEQTEAFKALKQDLQDAPSFPAQELLKEDARDIERRLTNVEMNQGT